MKRQGIVGTYRLLLLRAIGAARNLGHGVKRGLIRSAAIATMLAIYIGTSIGSMAPAALGVAGVSGLALTATATPADAWRRRRRRRRWHRGYYRGGWGWYGRRRRRRRYYRRRRRGGVSIYLRF